MTQTTEIIPRSTADVIPTGEAMILIAPLLDSIPSIDGASDDAIALRILQAESPDEVFAGVEAVDFAELIDSPIHILALRRGQSDYEDGLGVFLVVEYQGASGRREVTTTGSSTVMVQLLKANALGMIPGLVVIPRKSKTPTKRGFYPMHLERVDA